MSRRLPDEAARGRGEGGGVSGAGREPGAMTGGAHPALAGRLAAYLEDPARPARFDRAVYGIRLHRDQAAAKLPGWEAIRQRAAAIKAHTLDHLDRYVDEFARRAEAAGAVVHFAETGEDANRIVHALCAARGVSKAVKSKSMTTEECRLNPYLEARGIEVIDTDLGERIVQLFGEPPSHIVAPAIHRTRQEVGDLFARAIGSPAGESDPARLIAAARRHLRGHFLSAGAGITGANFAVAETGSVVVVENEGNSLLTTTCPPLHIVVMGLEKVVPTLADLSVLLRLLARSATGQRITIYTTHYTGPQKRGGAEAGAPGREMHVVILDNGRSRLLADAEHKSALGCIRCGACLNTCPVYRRSGGHAYGWVYPGPIGSVLAPALKADRVADEMPFASSLCGACTAICPVKIDLHEQLLRWRRRLVAQGRRRRALPSALAWLMGRPRLYRWVMAGARRSGWLVRPLARSWRRPRGGRDSRALPAPARRTFQDWWRENRG